MIRLSHLKAIATLSLVWSLLPQIAEAHLLSNEPMFAAIPWGSTEAETTRLLSQAGFTFDAKATKLEPDATLDFSGEVVGGNAEVYEDFDIHGRLVQTVVDIMTNPDECEATYNTVAARLREKNYEPSMQVIPDSHSTHSQAKESKTEWWGTPGKSNRLTVGTLKGQVYIIYESEGWNSEWYRRALAKPDNNL